MPTNPLHRFRIISSVANSRQFDFDEGPPLSITNMTLMDNNEVDDIVDRMVRQYHADWRQLLVNKDMVINPAAPDDLLDIGTEDAADPPVFTPATNGKKRRIKCLHMLNVTKSFWLGNIAADANNTEVAVAGDAGKTAQEIRKEKREAARAAAAALIGDTESDDA